MVRTKRNIALFFAVYFLQGMCFYGPVATLYRQSCGLTVLDITVIESICLGLMLALELPWGWVADRIGHRRTIVLCTVLFALSKVVFWRAETFGGFLLERVLLAVALSGLSGCDSAYLYACVGEENGQRAFGLWEASQTAGLLVAAACSSLFLRDDYRLAGLWTVWSYGLAALLVFFLGEPKEDRTAAPADRPKAALPAALRQSLSMAPFLLGAALLAETSQFATVFLNQLVYRRAGIPTAWFGVLYGLVTLASLLGARSQALTARLGTRRGGAVLFLTGAAACVLMALLPVPAAAVGGMVLLRVSAALFSPLSLAVQNGAAHPAARATQLSCNAMVLDVVAIAVNPAFGSAADRGVPLALVVGAAACGAGLALFLWGTRKPFSPKDRN